MKTPRHVLLEQHQAAQSKLDALRRKFVASLDAVPESPSPRIPDAPRNLISVRGLLPALRWHGAGLAAAWMLIALLNSLAPQDQEKSRTSSSARWHRPVRSDLLENRRQIVELIQASPGANESAPEAPTPTPRRQGTRGSTNSMA